MNGTNINTVHRTVRRPAPNGGFGSGGNRVVRFVVRPAVGCPRDHEIQLLVGVVAFPISAVVGEEVAVAVNPNTVK